MSSNTNPNQGGAVFFWLCSAACLVSIVVCFFIGLVTGNWSGEGQSWAGFLVTAVLAGALSDPRPKSQRNTPLRNHPRHCMCLSCEYGPYSRRKV